MPLVTLTLCKPKDSAFKDAVLTAVHDALVTSGVPKTDLFQRVLELDAEDFRFDPAYPDLQRPRTDDFVLIDMVWSAGRSVKVKKAIVADIVDRLAQKGFDPEHVMVCFKETTWESWSFGGGRFLHA